MTTNAKLLYSSAAIIVREIRKRDGSIGYGLFRPWVGVSAILEYTDLEEAVFVAHYADMQGGSLSGEIRKAAKRAWKAKMSGVLG